MVLESWQSAVAVSQEGVWYLNLGRGSAYSGMLLASGHILEVELDLCMG